jgi:hypothetical protein
VGISSQVVSLSCIFFASFADFFATFAVKDFVLIAETKVLTEKVAKRSAKDAKKTRLQFLRRLDSL